MSRQREALANPEVRRVFEEEVLFGEATETIAGLLESLGMSQRELARRLSLSEGRVSQILSGEDNLTLRTLAAIGWALGVRFELDATPMEDRAGTPAEDDPPAPAWLTQLKANPSIVPLEFFSSYLTPLTLSPRPLLTPLTPIDVPKNEKEVVAA